MLVLLVWLAGVSPPAFAFAFALAPIAPPQAPVAFAGTDGVVWTVMVVNARLVLAAATGDPQGAEVEFTLEAE